ncbi:OmpA family protein [Flammeovirgaceae bacterium SG7u.111]|nr:OmpA family protein [Flammeovirgaceae bacterium SG7u.132]WPO34022.1 OmpA family protein [Flammeovirgaceae bacterium SG7u.111]
MNPKKLLFFALILFPVLSVFAQGTESKKALKLYESAQKYKQSRNFDKAIEELEKSVRIDPNFADAHRELGYFYLVLREVKKSRVHYEKAAELAPDNKDYIIPYIMVAQFHIGDGLYSSAKVNAEKFLSFNPSTRYQRDINLAKKIIATADYALEGMKNPLNFNPTPLSKIVNRYSQQYFPVLTADQKTLIFTARVGHNDENMYESQFVDSAWQEPVYMEELNTHFNEGTCSISADGKTLIFTACEGSRERQVIGACDLFISRKVGGVWSKPENMGNVVNGRSWESQPSLSADGRTLYFVSDRSGTLGGNDIWVTRMNSDDQWTHPTNLGNPINTPGDEVSPFIHANGKTLFFSSDGLMGYGKLDLFQTELENETWAEPSNLGYPINDHNAQVSLFISADGLKGFYSHEDIQDGRVISSVLTSFDVPEEIRIKNISDYVKGKVFDAETKEPLGANIDLTDIVSRDVISNVVSDPKDGDYLIVLTEGSEYALHVQKKGYLYKSLSFNYSEKHQNGIELDIYLDPIKEGSTVTLSNIFFESGSYELLPKSKTELLKLIQFLKENEDMKIEIGGHTDDVGSDTDNKVLSLNRARSVVQYLESAGVPEKRMTYKGYGETEPVASNETDEGKAQNRRIEFKII